MTLSPQLRNFLLKTVIKKSACYTFGTNELMLDITLLGVEYLILNDSTWTLLNTFNSSSQWELEISRVLNENYRQAKLPQLQEEQRKRDEFWRLRDGRD